MRAIRFSGVPVVLWLLVFPGCGGRAPTQPTATVDLGGHWTGTINSVGDTTTALAICRSDPVSADVSQNGATVSASLLSSCAGPFVLTGEIDGTSLTGSLTSGSNEGIDGRVAGFVSHSSIQITVGHARKDEFVPVLQIQLSR